MRLDFIEISGFRGFREKVRIDFGAGFTVLSGRNGVGKSTICDAVEFALTGSIDKYAVEKADKESIADYLWWRGDGTPATHYVTAAFKDESGERFSVTRTRESGPDKTVAQIELALCFGAKPDDALRQLCKTSIIRDEWIAALSVDLTETERFELVRSALGPVEGLDYGVKGKEVLTSAEVAHSRNESAYEQIRSQLTATLAQLTEATDTIDAVLAVENMDGEGADWTVLRDRQMTRLAADDAVTLTEVLALTGRDFDASAETVFAGKSRRTVEIGPLRTAELREYVATCPFQILPDGPLFVSNIGGPIHQRTAQQRLQHLGERLGLPDRISGRTLRSGGILRKRLEGRPDKKIIAEAGLTSTQHFARRFRNLPMDPRRIERAKEAVRRNLMPDLVLSESHASRPPAVADTPSQEPLLESEPISSAAPTRVAMKRLFRDEHLDEYIDDECPHPSYVGHLRRFRDYLLSNGLSADQATARDIERFYLLRAQTCKENTVAITHTAVHEFYVHAFRSGLVSQVPTLDVEPPAQLKAPPIAASRAIVKLWIEKVEDFIAKCHEPNLGALRIAALIALCALEGVKIGRARYLTPLDLREPAPEGPWATLGHHAAMCLARIAQAAPASKFFFSARDPQHPVSAQHARKWLHAWEVKLKLPPITYEQLTQAYKKEFLEAEPDVYSLAISTGERGMSGYEFQELSEPTRDGTGRSTQLALELYAPPGGWAL